MVINGRDPTTLAATERDLRALGIRVVAISSLWLFFLLSAPFVLLVLIAPFKAGALTDVAVAPSTSNIGLIGGLLICMWNYMGWDNASTIATEVKRPQRTYPRAMIVAVIVVAATYVVPFAAMWLAGVPANAFETGSWADIAGMMGGLVGGPLVARGFRVALVLGGWIVFWAPDRLAPQGRDVHDRALGAGAGLSAGDGRHGASSVSTGVLT